MPETLDNRLLKWTIVASQFAPPFMFSGVAVALPAMGTDLDAGATTLGLVETLFLAGTLSFLLPIGRLADASDKNTLYKLGLLGFGLSSLLLGALSSVPAILVIRFLQGVTSAIFAATGPAILADIVPVERRGRAYGASMGAIYAGLTLGPIVAGLLIETWGWRAVFVFGGATLLGMYGLVRTMLPSAWRRPVSTFHLPSAALIMASVLSLVAGTAALGRGWIGYSTLAVGVVLAVVFIRLQGRVDDPLLDFRALAGHRTLRNALLVQLLLYMNAFCSIFMLSIYMQVSLGRSAETAGQVIASGQVLMAVMAPVSGVLSDRFSPRAISSIGVATVLASALLALTLDEHSSLALVVLVLAVQGVGFAFFSSPNMATIMSSASAGATTMASALGAMARSIGMVAGMLITAILISFQIGDGAVAEHPQRFLDTMVMAFAVFAGLNVIALVVSLRSGPRP